MKKSIIVVVFLLGLIVLPQVQAQEQQLAWGVTPDLRIRYSVTKTGYFTPSYGEHAFLHEEYEAIASFSYYPPIRPQYWDSNGVDDTFGYLYFVNGSEALGYIRVFPIGDWSRVQASDSISTFELVYGGQEVLRNTTYFEDESTWGRRYNFTDIRQYDYDTIRSYFCNITVTQIFSKTDGAIVIEEIIWDYLGYYDPGCVIRTYARIDEYSESGRVTQQIIIIGVGLAAVVIVVSFHWFKIKRRS